MPEEARGTQAERQRSCPRSKPARLLRRRSCSCTGPTCRTRTSSSSQTTTPLAGRRAHSLTLLSDSVFGASCHPSCPWACAPEHLALPARVATAAAALGQRCRRQICRRVGPKLQPRVISWAPGCRAVCFDVRRVSVHRRNRWPSAAVASMYAATPGLIQTRRSQCYSSRAGRTGGRSWCSAGPAAREQACSNANVLGCLTFLSAAGQPAAVPPGLGPAAGAQQAERPISHPRRARRHAGPHPLQHLRRLPRGWQSRCASRQIRALEMPHPWLGPPKKLRFVVSRTCVTTVRTHADGTESTARSNTSNVPMPPQAWTTVYRMLRGTWWIPVR